MGQLDQTTLPTIRKRICDTLTAAELAAPNGVQAQTLRLIKCAMSDRDVSARSRGECAGCDDTDIQKLLATMVAQREVSAREYSDAGRISDAEREQDEIEVIDAFLPKPLQGEALSEAVAAVIVDLEASRLKDIGRCMTALRERFPDQIECGSAGKVLRMALG